jgi:hypothetical protein
MSRHGILAAALAAASVDIGGDNHGPPRGISSGRPRMAGREKASRPAWLGDRLVARAASKRTLKGLRRARHAYFTLLGRLA